MKIFWQGLSFQRKSLIYWGLGMVGLIILYLALYPSIKESAAELNAYINKLPETFRDAFIDPETNYATPLGYLSTEIYSQMLPILFLIFSITFGASAIAGEEEKGTIDILLSTPIRRSSVILEKFLTLVVSLLILSTILLTTIFFGSKVVGIEVTFSQLFSATFILLLFGINFGTVAIFLGSLTGSKGLAIGLTTAFAVIAYLVNVFYKLTDVLDKVKEFSPFYHYSHQNALVHGIPWASAELMIFITVGLILLSVAAFARRDLNI